MFFDDRLSTVLRQDASTEIAQRTQFRQLLDILGNRKFAPAARRDQSLIAAAWLRMDALGHSIPAQERAGMIRETSWRFRSADLATHLADFEPDVASAALARAQLESEEWLALIPRLPVRARGFLRLRRDLPSDVVQLLDQLGVSDRGLPSPEAGSMLDKQPPYDLTEEASEDPSRASVFFSGESDEQMDPVLDTDDFPIIPEGTGEIAPDPKSEPEPEPEIEPEPELGSESKVEPEPQATPAPVSAPDPIETGRSEISALVERIAQFKRTRDTADQEALLDSQRSPRLPLGEVEPTRDRIARNFGFAADVSGRIEWADPEVASMVIGTRLVEQQMLGEDRHESALDIAFARRQPIIQADTDLFGAPAIAGEWIVDAQPCFADAGHFTGYVGRFRRPQSDEDRGPTPAEKEADRIRQLLHELRTPVTAVQGYAEVIQQQLFGPAPHTYRALAAGIAADAARILAGFEELDRLALLEGGALSIEPGTTDLAALARQTSAQLAQVLAPRMAGIEIAVNAAEPVNIPIDAEDAELLIWRLLGTLGGGCAAGETLKANLVTADEEVHLTCDLPRQLLETDDIFNAEARVAINAINAGVFGAGFALRLARAEARAAHGDLIQVESAVKLVLPLVEPASQIAPPEAKAPGQMTDEPQQEPDQQSQPGQQEQQQADTHRAS